MQQYQFGARIRPTPAPNSERALRTSLAPACAPLAGDPPVGLRAPTRVGPELVPSFEVSAGALDERLQLDEHTGELTVVAGAAGDALPDFAVRACVLRPWTLQGGGAAAVGATASSRLQALVAEEALEACRALLREPAVSSAGGGGRSIVAAVFLGSLWRGGVIWDNVSWAQHFPMTDRQTDLSQTEPDSATV